MKRLLIPILTTVAIAPVATSIVACNNATANIVNLEFQEDFMGEDIFVEENLNIQENKEYKIVADFSKVPDETLYDWEETALGFGAYRSKTESNPLAYAKDKIKIVLNDDDITETIEEEEGKIWIVNHTWEKKDKLIITFVWTENADKALVVLMPD